MISVGIDASKNESTVCIMKPGGEILKAPFKIEHSVRKMLSFVDLINSYAEEARVGLEDTGHCHLSVVTMLVEKGIFVCTVNGSADEKILFTKPS